MEEPLFMPGEALAIAEVTRDEASQWYRNGLMNVPPAVPATGRARRYSFINIVEMSIFKQLVATGEVGISLRHAHQVMQTRLRCARHGPKMGHPGDEPRFTDRPVVDAQALNSVSSLAATEFDTSTHLFGKHVYWYIAPTPDVSGVVLSSWRTGLTDEWLRAQLETWGKAIVFDLTRALYRIYRALPRDDRLTPVQIAFSGAWEHLDEDADTGWTGA